MYYNEINENLAFKLNKFETIFNSMNYFNLLAIFKLFTIFTTVHTMASVQRGVDNNNKSLNQIHCKFNFELGKC